MKIFFIFKHIIYQGVLMTIIDKNAVVAFTSSELKTILENDNGYDMVYKDNIKYGWSKIQHYVMQESYYLYQYSIGTAIACNISKRILDNEPKILEKYIKFLSTGNSVSIKESLSYLDIDLENGDYIENALYVLNNSIKELKKIKRKKL